MGTACRSKEFNQIVSSLHIFQEEASVMRADPSEFQCGCMASPFYFTILLPGRFA